MTNLKGRCVCSLFGLIDVQIEVLYDASYTVIHFLSERCAGWQGGAVKNPQEGSPEATRHSPEASPSPPNESVEKAWTVFVAQE